MWQNNDKITKDKWRYTWSKETFIKGRELDFIEIKFNEKQNSWEAYRKIYEKVTFNPKNYIIEPIIRGRNYGNLINEQNMRTSNSSSELKQLFPNKNTFSFAKPINLIKNILKIINKKNPIILDFFAGSGTTAHSVLSSNKEDGGNRKFILLEQMDYIESITSERIKRCMIKEGYEDSFVYMEMKESNTKELKNSVKSSKSKKELISIINDNFDNGYFINIDNKEQILLKIEDIHSKATKKSNPLNDSIKLIIEKHMDNNLDYVSYEDIEELKQSNKIKENEYKLNKSFYGEV